MNEIIKLKNIQKSFKDAKVLRGISFDIRKGETFVLLGKSGSGKTTLLKLLNRLIDADSGEIEIFGKNILDYKTTDLRRQLGYVIQKIGLLPHLTILNNLKIPHLINKDSQENDFYFKLLEQVNLDISLADKYPSQLSGGQQQRVGLARALVTDPDIILMDEPFSALDPITRYQMQEDMLHLDSLKDKTIVLVTHDIEEAVKLGDRIALLKDGVVLQLDTPEKILFNPANEFVEDFFQKDRFGLKLKNTRISELDIGSVKNGMSVYDALQDGSLEAVKKVQILKEYYDLEKGLAE